jgi:hypothetical protein
LSDVTTLEWVWDRMAHTVASAEAGEIEAQLKAMRTAADAEDLEAAADAADGLRSIINR